MVAEKIYVKRFNPYLGINLQSSKLNQNPLEVVDGKNFMYGRNNEITKRPGSKTVFSFTPDQGYRSVTVPYYNSGMAGAFSYTDINQISGFCLGLIPFSYNVQTITSNSSNLRSDKLLAILGGLDSNALTLRSFNFYELAEQYLSISTTNVASSFNYKHEVDSVSNTFKFRLSENGTAIYTLDLGTGFEATPVTVATLITGINTVAGYTATVVQGVNQPFYNAPTALPTNPGSVAFIGPFNYDIKTPPKIDISYFSLVPHDQRNSASVYGINAFSRTFFVNQSLTFGNLNTPLQATSCVIGNSLYVAGGGYSLYSSTLSALLGGIARYDGYRVKPAGLYAPSNIQYVSQVNPGAVFPFSASYRYAMSVEYVDRNGDTIESNLVAMDPLATIGVAAGGASSITMSVDISPYAGSATTQYPHAYRIQTTGTGTTITVDDGAGNQHYLLPGDEVYLKTGTGTYGTRKVTAVTGLNVTLDNTVTTTAGDAISLNYRVNVYRTKNGGQDFYLAFQAPMGYTATYNVVDTVSEANLGAKYIYPLKEHLPPPPGKLCCEHQNCLVVANITKWKGDYYQLSTDDVNPSKNVVYFSSEEHPEYFNYLNNFVLPLSEIEEITALKSLNGTLYIFTNKQIFYVHGILNDNYTVKRLTNNIGCVGQNTIIDVNGTVYFADNENVYMMVDGSLPQKIGTPIKNMLKLRVKGDVEPSKQTKYIYNRACAGYFKKYNLYVLSLPAIDVDESSVTNSIVYNPTHSIIFVYNIDTGAWYFWKDLFINSFALYKDELWFSTIESNTAGRQSSIRKFLQDDTSYQSYADGVNPISFVYKPAWETLDDPGVCKIPNNLFVYSVDNKLSRDFNLDVLIEKDFGVNSRTTSFTLNFPISSQPDPSYIAYSKLDSNKTRSLRISLSNNVLYENICISGYEYEIVPDIDIVGKK